MATVQGHGNAEAGSTYITQDDDPTTLQGGQEMTEEMVSGEGVLRDREFGFGFEGGVALLSERIGILRLGPRLEVGFHRFGGRVGESSYATSTEGIDLDSRGEILNLGSLSFEAGLGLVVGFGEGWTGDSEHDAIQIDAVISLGDYKPLPGTYLETDEVAGVLDVEKMGAAAQLDVSAMFLIQPLLDDAGAVYAGVIVQLSGQTSAGNGLFGTRLRTNFGGLGVRAVIQREVGGEIDTDGDGLTNEFEKKTSLTDPKNPDTDGDGVDDGTEYSDSEAAGMHDVDDDGNPNYLDNDADGDKIMDGVDGAGHNDDDDLPNYLDTDSDEDGYTDYDEAGSPSDLIQDARALPNTDGTDDGADYVDTDSDDEGLLDAAELSQGTERTNPDSDGDDLTDFAEVATHTTNPNNPDTDGDGLQDGAEVNTHSTDPTKEDTDGDGLQDGLEIQIGTDPNKKDSDGDGIDDALETDNGAVDAAGKTIDTDGDGTIDALDEDSDDDGITDAREWDDSIIFGRDPDQDDIFNWRDLDSDGDEHINGGGTDAVEGTDPVSPDVTAPAYLVKANSLVLVTDNKIEILEKIYFRQGSAQIETKSFKLLDEIASTLQAYPDILRVEISGHASREGRISSNKSLSQRRADSVMQALIARGVDASRLEAAGYGEKYLIHPSTGVVVKPDDDAGRDAANTGNDAREPSRRTEFYILSRSTGVAGEPPVDTKSPYQALEESYPTDNFTN